MSRSRWASKSACIRWKRSLACSLECSCLHFRLRNPCRFNSAARASCRAHPGWARKTVSDGQKPPESLGSLYPILMGPTAVDTHKPPPDFSSFQVAAFLIGITILGSLEWIKRAAVNWTSCKNVTTIFYFVLKYFNTANIVPSTISVTTTFLAAYLTFRKSPCFALTYASNDIVLIISWVLASLPCISSDIRI